MRKRIRQRRKNHLVLRAGGSCVDLASDTGLAALKEEVGLCDSGGYIVKTMPLPAEVFSLSRATLVYYWYFDK